MSYWTVVQAQPMCERRALWHLDFQGFKTYPAHLPDRWITDMKSKERNGLIVLPKHRFDIGQRVVVFSGPFAGQRGMYYGQGSRQREIVLLEALGRVELAPGLLR